MSKQLTERDVINVIKEEWIKRMDKLSEEIDLELKSKIDKKEKTVISPDLKIVHKDSGIKYTISSVGPRDVILRNPEGKEFLIDIDELENEYELD